MYVFWQALNTALHNKILQLSPMPTILAGLVEKAREFDRNWCTFTGPTRGFKCSEHNLCIQEISEEESKVNATQTPCYFLFGQGHRQGHGKLTPQEHTFCMDNNLCLYCGTKGHRMIDCIELPNYRPGNSSFRNQ